MINRRTSLTFAIVILLFVQTGCALPPLKGRTQSEAFSQEQTADTRLGEVVNSEAGKHPGLSGITTLENPIDAFTARVLLAEASDRSLDVQYYIWQYDITGKLLLYTLYRAAERGVRVRLLLDDNGIGGMDRPLAALNSHSNIEVRLFNPFVVRHPKLLGNLLAFDRLNHRMHNKSFTADNQATIIGGRNISDEYFGAGTGILFSDLDVLAIGPVANRVSKDFDRYWSSASAYPAERLLPAVREEALPEFVLEVKALERSAEARRFVAAVEASEMLRDILAQDLTFIWAPVEVMSDDPAKALDEHSATGLLSQQLARAIGTPETSLTLVSSYFVPGNAGVALFRDLEESGVQVRILTNSLAANDVALVHAGYAKYRKPLLRAGVELYEMRKLAPERSTDPGLLGSSASSLHAKTFAVDGETLFVGSFNFDPRSAHINTELGFLIKSPELAEALESGFAEQVRFTAYEVVLNSDGDLRWLEFTGTETIRHRHEPDTGLLKRTLVFLLSLLPVEPLL
ncbi:hypothetical protein BKP64_15150 [Marinobacter salinus]|uniref:PLD phosphodiesterase domain-containing protein n=1 Tax=Marinobacter salinus TaxID=1874317 RepID=A0A1D9GSF5_9GAMM|nr:phospholipase D family protein [Marinobacter salinus]AOY90310.1 hypothetical protein BKP64_15150 [Marinobacter salinus]